MTLTLSEPCPFKVGETYRTRGCSDAVILEVGPDGDLYGRINIDNEPEWYGMCWSKNGRAEQNISLATNDDMHLLPPKRQVWVAVWRDRGCATVQTLACDNECHAKRVASKDNRTRIAVLGPIGVEPGAMTRREQRYAAGILTLQILAIVVAAAGLSLGVVAWWKGWI